jgi:hypothetical protein
MHDRKHSDIDSVFEPLHARGIRHIWRLEGIHSRDQDAQRDGRRGIDGLAPTGPLLLAERYVRVII